MTRHRIRNAYGPEIEETFEVIGEPASVPDAAALAKTESYQFQWWALGLVGARPVEKKKGADHGIDGRIFFSDGQERQIILSVKGGGVTVVSQVRDLRGVVERERAVIGVLISFEAPTEPMKKEAATAGFYKSPWRLHPKIQLLTVEQLMTGQQIDYPLPGQVNLTFKKAQRVEKLGPKDQKMSFEPS